MYVPSQFTITHERADRRLVFSKTLFTPAGIDIYVRSTPSTQAQQTGEGSMGGSEEQRQEVLERVISALQAQKGDVGELAKKGFQVPGVV